MLVACGDLRIGFVCWIRVFICVVGDYWFVVVVLVCGWWLVVLCKCCVCGVAFFWLRCWVLLIL